ncbi:hypothetical protein QZH41_011926 [Actinostola sp. cb2023]|nr:hypothetical protein QZH41_011926 [Actinostola sp. cb2023]
MTDIPIDYSIPLDVTYNGECARDYGGPRGEFLGAIVKAIKDRLFKEHQDEEGFVLMKDITALQKQYYYAAGIFFACNGKTLPKVPTTKVRGTPNDISKVGQAIEARLFGGGHQRPYTGRKILSAFLKAESTDTLVDNEELPYRDEDPMDEDYIPEYISEDEDNTAVKDNNSNKAINNQQSNEVSSANAMEKEGFVRAVTDLKSKDINIKTLVTDRHPQIQKYAREQMPNTDHEYDSWHVVKDSKAYINLLDILNKPMLLKDIRKMSTYHQTSSLEAYHAVLNHFAPKMTAFSYQGMYCRLKLAALHFNENCDRGQSFTKEGQPKYNLSQPKYKNGATTVSPILEDCTYSKYKTNAQL